MSLDREDNEGQDTTKPPESFGQRLLAVIVTAFLLIGALLAYAFAPSLITRYRADVPFFESPSFVPRVALALVAICALVHAIRVVRGASLDAGEDMDDARSDSRLVVAGVSLFAAYVFAVPYIGYAFATAGFVVVAGIVAGIGGVKSAVLAVSLSATLFAAFVIGLKVWFPDPALLQWLF
jgi:Tripartite tricarboxylate transporter TctB family